ncbi:DUF5123 domain-containing protein [Autumnicola edwardsiae]|uniref:DUF4957 domain-containing protein n=1 Tax=Autumnicola edwardsiae TaxID=3075594 RepID=A0ABU3CZ39_9FLAO|nr:DUF5123 domain-containing protein [Zunongwangia sp. F297]MDT0651521.1 DUF4957 domain-containing protein [Zunongwangia sp. F297]
MKLKYIFKSLLIAILLVATVTSCDYDEELVEELPVDREFAPVNLTAFVRNQVNVELNWTVNDNANSYIVEFANDSLQFNNIVRTVEVNPDELPVLVPLESETLYSIRVKAISERGIDDSSWATTTARTLTEQIFIEGEDGDIKSGEAILRWVPGSEVTEINLSPGDITYTITAEDRAAGIATVTGLSSETDYTATLLNGSQIRGVKEFTTGIDIGDGKLVTPEDDLLQMIADAVAGDIFVLEPGDYTDQTGTITLDKSLTIRGLRSFDKPLLQLNFEIVAGAEDVELIDLDLQGLGEGSSDLSDFVRYTGPGNFNSLLISGCNIHDYGRSFIAGNETDAILQTLTVENSIVYDIFTSGGDFIDFRNSDVLNINLLNNTFYNVAPDRDFIRMDASGTSNDTGLTSNVLIDSNTLYSVSNNESSRLLYIRFVSNDVTVRNTLIVNTESEGYADREGIDESPSFSNNNYFNAPGFYDTAQYIFDDTSYFNLDPGFVDPPTGDFTVTNQTLIDNQIGDPRWR